MQLVWSFDEGILTGRAGTFGRRPGARRVPDRRAARSLPIRRWLASGGLRRGGSWLLAGLVLVYLSLAGLTCARWCELFGLTGGAGSLGVTAAGSAHQHHAHASAASLQAGDPAALPVAPTAAAPALSLTTCQVQAPSPAGLMAPLLREAPLPTTGVGVALAALAALIWRAPVLAPAALTLAPPELPPRRAR